MIPITINRLKGALQFILQPKKLKTMNKQKIRMVKHSVNFLNSCFIKELILLLQNTKHGF